MGMVQIRTLRILLAAVCLNPAIPCFARAENHSEELYWQAVEAKEIAAAVHQAVPPADLKESLLSHTRDADRSYAKQMLLHWKQNSTLNVQSEFNHLILRSKDGREILRVAPVGTSVDQFQINGMKWTVPQNGSVAESLKRVLAERKTGASLFDLITPRAFADEPLPGQAIAFLYATVNQRREELRKAENQKRKDLMATPEQQLRTWRPEPYLVRSEGSVPDRLWDQVVGNPVKLRCSADSASGHIKLAGESVAFTVFASDSSTIFTSAETGKSFKVFSSGSPTLTKEQTPQTDLHFFACADAMCTKTVGAEKKTLSAFLDVKDVEAVDIATTFRPRDGDTTIYPIDRRCETKADCLLLEIRDLKKLSARDQEWALKYRDEANVAIMKQESDNNQMIRAILPLGECCQSASCRRSVLAQGIDLAPDGSATSATNHPKATVH